MEEKVREAFEKEGIKNEIRCEEAFSISEQYDIPKMEIARYCNKHEVKIRGCQLGCFR
jgi:hypothetical protein